MHVYIIQGPYTTVPSRNYLLAQAHVDAAALGSSIAHLNTASTFSPLQPLQDTDVAGYLRHAHEQNLISTIEEGRRETQQEFYRVLEDRSRRDWDAKKKRVFEELGGRIGSDNRTSVDMKKTFRAKGNLSVSGFLSTIEHSNSIWQATTTPALTLQMQSKMMAYDRVISELNTSRLRGTSYPIVHALMQASLTVTAADVRNSKLVNARFLTILYSPKHYK